MLKQHLTGVGNRQAHSADDVAATFHCSTHKAGPGILKTV